MMATREEKKIWVCMACGRWTEDKRDLNNGWDEACFLNAAQFLVRLCRFSEDGRRVEHVDNS